MRRIALCLAALAFAGCSPAAQKTADSSTAAAPNAAAPAATGLAAVFPDLFSSSFRVEATVTRDNGEQRPLVMVRDHGKVRIEVTSEEGLVTIISNPDRHETLMVMNRGGQPLVLRTSGSEADNPDIAAQWRSEIAASAHAIGPCSGAGETGTEWERQDASGDAGSVCVTSDGIILRATKNGRTVWETTRVQRGPQDPAQFAAPEGARVMNLGAGAQAALQRLQAKRP